MNEPLLGIDNLDSVIVLGILFLFAIIEIIAGYLSRTQRTFSDWIQEAGGFLVLVAFIKPSIVSLVLILGNTLFPDALHLWSNWSIWLMLPFYLLIDDLLQYWYHRAGHEYEFLWKLHRSHHQAEEMGFFISYRNAGLYYLMMPNIWWIGFIVFIGGAKAVAIGLILKQLIIIGSHSTISWDKPLYKSKIFSPIMTIIERIIGELT